jgi:hypothetical protein
MIIAKPIIDKQYWILKENDKKVGQVEAGPQGFVVKLNNDQVAFKTIKTLKNRTKIIFEPAPTTAKKPVQTYDVNGFATTSRPYNAVYDVQKRLPMFTKKNKSKSWFAAGYYQVCLDGKWQTVFCPKLILLQRYPYRGPVYSPDQFTFK